MLYPCRAVPMAYFIIFSSCDAWQQQCGVGAHVLRDTSEQVRRVYAAHDRGHLKIKNKYVVVYCLGMARVSV